LETVLPFRQRPGKRRPASAPHTRMRQDQVAEALGRRPCASGTVTRAAGGRPYGTPLGAAPSGLGAGFRSFFQPLRQTSTLQLPKCREEHDHGKTKPPAFTSRSIPRMPKGNMNAIWSWLAPKPGAAISSRRKTSSSTLNIICGQCTKAAARAPRAEVPAWMEDRFTHSTRSE
jgi:hypothetical protein